VKLKFVRTAYEGDLGRLKHRVEDAETGRLVRGVQAFGATVDLGGVVTGTLVVHDPAVECREAGPGEDPLAPVPPEDCGEPGVFLKVLQLRVARPNERPHVVTRVLDRATGLPLEAVQRVEVAVGGFSDRVATIEFVGPILCVA
jgi:hypothetical protein